MIGHKLPLETVILAAREAGQLQGLKQYLLDRQAINARLINDALNEVLVADGDEHGLRQSISTYNNFTQVSALHADCAVPFPASCKSGAHTSRASLVLLAEGAAPLHQHLW